MKRLLSTAAAALMLLTAAAHAQDNKPSIEDTIRGGFLMPNWPTSLR